MRASIAIVVLVLGGGLGYWLWTSKSNQPFEQLAQTERASTDFSDEDVRAFCAACHAYTPPELLSRRAWRVVLEKMFRMYIPDPPPSGRMLDADAIEEWFTSRAPRRLEFPPSYASQGSGPLAFEREEIFHPAGDVVTSIAHLAEASVVGTELQLVLSDMLNGTIGLWIPSQSEDPLLRIADLVAPAHTQVIDFDADGRNDLVVADLGGFQVDDHDRGRVVWLRQREDGAFESRVLLDAVGRVSDARAADFDADGDLDLVVAVFGWFATGELLLLENTGEPEPRFERRVLDQRTGAMHVPVVDFDGDGDLDIITIHAQQHEVVTLHRNMGGLRFELATLFSAPHPGWGSTGIEPVDIDADGDLDIVMVNGDILDSYQVKPVHGVHLLVNDGNGSMRHEMLATFPGAHRSRSADLDGDGDLDIVAASFLLEEGVPRFVDASQIESLIWLEQTGPCEFERHSLEAGLADHTALEVIDVDADGDLDVVTGSYAVPGFEARARRYPLTLLRNLGAR